jgi:Dyp-type peroxidase family
VTLQQVSGLNYFKKMATLETLDIQGFVLTSYAKNMPCANYMLLKINQVSACKDWLKDIIPNITTGTDRKTDYCLNIAFTANAFKKFGFTDSEFLSFSVPFQEGMTTASRKAILGDDGESAVENWAWGNPEAPVDIVLLLFANSEIEIDKRLTEIKTNIESQKGVEIIRSLSAGRQPTAHEHFGFLDGVGQPVIEGTDKKASQLNRTGHATVIKAGEFILGYENEMQKIDDMPKLDKMQNFGRNGTYIVFRQLEQRVDKFWNYIKEKAADNSSGVSSQSDQDRLAAKMVGRWRSGAPLTLNKNSDPATGGATIEENNFGFANDDIDGFGCPVGAHIRRTNPRDSLFNDPEISLLTVNRHRIIRRGRSYGDRTKDVYQNDGKERGLFFFCINSNIERQFEFIQQMWINNPNFDSLNSENDPLTGGRSEINTFTVQGCPARTRVHQLPDFVITKGGAYFFMPGMKALKLLAG